MLHHESEIYYVYVLESLANGKHYVGYTQNILESKTHNQGKVRSTKSYKPYKLAYKEMFNNKTAARRRELFFKSGQGRGFIKSVLDKEENLEECPSGLRRQS